MEVVAGIASVAGIIGLGIQIAQTLQKEIDTVAGADGRIQHIVIELHATATNLSNLQSFLDKDSQNPNTPIFTDEARREIMWYTQRCDSIFRKIAVLLAKSGKAALARVDAFQRDVQNRPKTQTQILPDVTLKIELSSLEHLMWPWRWPKIEQSIADLDRVKLALLLVLNVANLGSKILRSVRGFNYSDYEWDNSIETLKDELYYRDQELAKAEKKAEKKQGTVKQVPSGIQSGTEIATKVIDDWPNLPDGGGVASFADLKDLGITLKGIALLDRGNHLYDRHDSYNYSSVPINVNERILYEEALMENKHSLESTRRLTVDQQMSIQDTLDYNSRRAGRMTVFPKVLSVSIYKNRRRKLLDILKSLTPLQAGIHGPARSSVYVIMADVEITAEENMTYRNNGYRKYNELEDDVDISLVRRPRGSEHTRPRARVTAADPRVVLRPQRSYERVRPQSKRSEGRGEIETRQREARKDREEKQRKKRESRRSPSSFDSDLDLYSTSSTDDDKQAITRRQASLPSQRGRIKLGNQGLGVQHYDHGIGYRRPTRAERDRVVNYYLRKWTIVFRYVRDIYHKDTTNASPHMTEIESRKKEEAADQNMTGTMVIANRSDDHAAPLGHRSTSSVGEMPANEESEDVGF